MRMRHKYKPSQQIIFMMLWCAAFGYFSSLLLDILNIEVRPGIQCGALIGWMFCGFYLIGLTPRRGGK